MPRRLKVAIGQHSDKGRKEINQDFHGACIPGEPQLGAKGIAVAIADGVHEFVEPRLIVEAVREHQSDLDAAARVIVAAALERGSDDNATVQIVRVEEVPDPEATEVHQQLIELPFPPELKPRSTIDGYEIVRELHASSRSHVYLAVDGDIRTPVVIKTLSVDLQSDPAQVERFLLEDWIARRIDSPHVVKAYEPTRRRTCLYTVLELVEGRTLTQWMIDHPKPPLEIVRDIMEQIARGLMAFHRLEMVHQDLRPENIMIDRTGTVKIVDFGSTRVAGIVESSARSDAERLLGTAQYTAPECFLGEAATPQSDLFSLGVITCQMLSGRLPYGAEVPKARTRAAQRKYQSVLAEDREIPAWIDEVLRKATHPDPQQRYAALSEVMYELRHPDETYLRKTRPPLIERHPAAFWKAMCLILVLVILALATKL